MTSMKSNIGKAVELWGCGEHFDDKKYVGSEKSSVTSSYFKFREFCR